MRKSNIFAIASNLTDEQLRVHSQEVGVDFNFLSSLVDQNNRSLGGHPIDDVIDQLELISELNDNCYSETEDELVSILATKLDSELEDRKKVLSENELTKFAKTAVSV